MNTKPLLSGMPIALALVALLGAASFTSAATPYSKSPPLHYGEDGTLLTPTWSGLTRTIVRNEGARDDAPDVAIVASAAGDVTDPMFTDPRDKLLTTGRFASVTVIHAGLETPSAGELGNFDAVLVWSNFDFQDAEQLGTNLADYVDAGGGVVLAVFGNTSPEPGRYLGGRWESEDYDVIPAQLDNLTGSATLGTIQLPDHQLAFGLSEFSGGLASFRPAAEEFHVPATLVAEWSDGQPLIAFRDDLGGARVDLGFYPPSSDVVSFFWDASTDGTRMMTNALIYASGVNPMDVVIQAVSLMAPSSVDTTNDPSTLPGQAPLLDCGVHPVVELWVSDVGILNTGIAALYVDLAYDNTKLRADSLVHTPLFPDFGPPLTDGAIDHPNGRVINFGSLTLTPEGVEPEWARLGYVEMTVLGTGATTVTVSLGDSGIGVSGREPPDESEIDFQAAVFADELLGDMDVDCDIDLVDFASFQLCFDLVGPPPECDLADFDDNGVIDIDDFFAFSIVLDGPQ